MSAAPLTRAELALEYPDLEWRKKFQRVLDAVSLLRSCIIEKSYKITDELNAAIVLSDAGRKVRDQLVTKEQVPTKEANLLALLAFAHLEPLVDVEKIDVEKLVAAISKEVRSGALKYPFVLGRTLYDRAADLFPEEREYLRHEDTLRLLRDQPQGVFQSGPYITGPLGVLTSDHERFTGPTTSIPLQHCSDHSCQSVHRVQLATSIEAAINRLRPALNKVLDEISVDPSDWNGFFSDVVEVETNSFDVNDYSTVLYSLADSLDDVELRTFFHALAEASDGRLVSRARAAGLAGDAVWASDLSRATIFQLLLTESDELIVGVLNKAISEGAIEVPEGEIRRFRINGRATSGSWHLQTQIGRRGVRVVGTADGLPSLRLTALVSTLFDTASPADMEALSWALRNVPGTAVEDRLAEFIRTASPREIVEALVLARKDNVDAVSKTLHITQYDGDLDFVETVIWRLGFGQTIQPDIRDEYWHRHESLSGLVKTAGVNIALNVAAIRSESVNYFVELERYLLDSVLFATWVLLHDHYVSLQPFTFGEADAQAFARTELANAGVELGARPTLSVLVTALTGLAKVLDDLRTHEAMHLRDVALRPKFFGKTDLQRFPLHHTAPFLDLTAESQVGLIGALRDAAKYLDSSGIMAARNALLHANRDVPKPAELGDALEVARRGLQALENVGLARSTFQATTTEIDAWGRGTIVLRSSDGVEITFSEPSSFRWIGFPPLQVPQFAVQGAVVAPPNVMLRFRRGYSSRYEEYWANYPKRRERGNKIVSAQSESLSTPIETGAFVGSRAD